MTSTKRDLARFRSKNLRLLKSYITKGEQKKRVVYRCKDSNGVFCAECANKLESMAITKPSDGRRTLLFATLPILDGGGIYCEGPPINCEMCNKELHSVKG